MPPNNTGDFFSARNYMEAAYWLCKAAPTGISEDLLVFIVGLDEKPIMPLSLYAYVPTTNSGRGRKIVTALRRHKKLELDVREGQNYWTAK